MKICRFTVDGVTGYGVIEGEKVFGIADPFVVGALAKRTGVELPLSSVRLLAPSTPTKIVAIGLNYKAHAAEFGKSLPEEPMIFLKPSTSVIGPNDEIVYPLHMSHRVDYEGELAVVVGKRAKDVAVHAAPSYILGYSCMNDVTARDLQGKDVQYTRAKSFDTFAPYGPWIETELDPLDVKIETYLNGEKKQDTSTADMIFNVYQLFSFVSRVMTLLPGDVITTGTPSGVGKMKPGNIIEVEITGIGRLTNAVTARQTA